MLNKPWSIAAITITALMFGACSDKPTDTTPAADAAQAPEETAKTTEKQALTPLPRSPSPPLASVFFITPADGDTVSNPVRIEFGLDGMDVIPAGVHQPQSGHHHLLIDTDLPDPSMPIPTDEHHIHFGDGSTSTELTLEPGKHTLQLLLGDHLHIPHDPPVASDTITITVE